MFLWLTAETWGILGSIAGILVAAFAIVGILYRLVLWLVGKSKRTPLGPAGRRQIGSTKVVTSSSAVARASDAGVFVPGRKEHGRLVANLNIRTNAHVISWISNGGAVATLTPTDHGGFDVEHRTGYLGSVKSVVAGMKLVERREDELERNAPKSVPLVRYFLPQRYHDNPLNVVLEAYAFLESWFGRTLGDRGINVFDGTRKLTVDEMAELAVFRGFIDPRAAETVHGLGILRELYMKKVDPQEARSFVVQVDGQMFAMDGQVAKFDVEQ